MARDDEEPDSLGIDVRMSGDEPQASELAIFLAQTWQSSPADRIDLDTLCRIWAFDLGWFNMQTATRVRDNLIETGWLDVTVDGAKPVVLLNDVDIPFGWLPTMRYLESPPRAPRKAIDEVHPVQDIPPIVDETIEMAAIDPAASHITELLDQISETSGLQRKEVMRRAQRKRRALGPVTLWMALLLVAREQQLSMAPLIHTISL